MIPLNGQWAEVLPLWSLALPGTPVSPDGLRFRWGEAENRFLLYRAGRLIGAVEVAAPEKPWDLSSTTGHLRYLLLHPEFRDDPEPGARLLEWAERRLRELGAYRVVFGGEPWHFFPGIPEGDLAPVLDRQGYAVGPASAADLRADLTALPEVQARPGVSFGPLHDPAALDAFLAEVFPGRWRHDAARVASLAPEQVLIMRRGDHVRGFALIGREGDPVPLPSFLWAGALTAGHPGATSGGLGPMGLHPDERGQGAGQVLLRAAMHALAARGVSVMGVDWTGIAPFYERSGFRVWQRYRHAHKTL